MGGKPPDETSSGVIIRPSILFRKEQQFQANPFALCNHANGCTGEHISFTNVSANHTLTPPAN